MTDEKQSPLVSGRAQGGNYSWGLVNGASAGMLAYLAVKTTTDFGIIMAIVAGGNIISGVGCMIRAHGVSQ